jgi:dCTP deaminase
LASEPFLAQAKSMTIKADKWIRRMAAQHQMIEPFEPGQIRTEDGRRIVSYGTSSYGYDVRCADEFKIFTNINSTIVDPKAFDEKSFVDFKGPICIIPPNSFALARTVEYFRIPRSVLTVCLGKSTYARCGIIVNVTPLEPEWEGHVTLEFSNTTPLPAKIYAGEGCAQMLFLESDEICETSYRDRGGPDCGTAVAAQRGDRCRQIHPGCLSAVGQTGVRKFRDRRMDVASGSAHDHSPRRHRVFPALKGAGLLPKPGGEDDDGEDVPRGAGLVVGRFAWRLQ